MIANVKHIYVVLAFELLMLHELAIMVKGRKDELYSSVSIT